MDTSIDRTGKLYTLSQVSEQTGISVPTLVRLRLRHNDQIPSVGKGRTQRYPAEALRVFRELLTEWLRQRGRRKRAPVTNPRASGDLLTLKEVARRARVSYQTAHRYVERYADRVPSEGAGRRRRYYPQAVDVFKEIRARTRRGRPARMRETVPDRELIPWLERLERGQEHLMATLKAIRRELARPLETYVN